VHIAYVSRELRVIIKTGRGTDRHIDRPDSVAGLTEKEKKMITKERMKSRLWGTGWERKHKRGE